MSRHFPVYLRTEFRCLHSRRTFCWKDLSYWQSQIKPGQSGNRARLHKKAPSSPLVKWHKIQPTPQWPTGWLICSWNHKWMIKMLVSLFTLVLNLSNKQKAELASTRFVLTVRLRKETSTRSGYNYVFRQCSTDRMHSKWCASVHFIFFFSLCASFSRVSVWSWLMWLTRH